MVTLTQKQKQTNTKRATIENHIVSKPFGRVDTLEAYKAAQKAQWLAIRKQSLGGFKFHNQAI